MTARVGLSAVVALATLHGQGGSTDPESRPASAFVAFRVDDSHAVAVVTVLDNQDIPKPGAPILAAPQARFGFSSYEPSAAVRARVPAALTATGWMVHAAPGLAFEASVRTVVGGSLGCQEGAGVLLAITPAEATSFRAVRERYFVAEPATASRRDAEARRSPVRALGVPSLDEARQAALRSVLDGLLAREWPAIRDEARPEIDRMAASTVGYHRSWAAARRRIEEEIAAGRVALSYDVQAYHLDPSGTPLYFVRAIWSAGSRQAFAVTVWLRGPAFEIVEADTGASSWLRMFEFEGTISREQLGLVLNVLDRDGDGWGEIIWARGGYEGLGIEVRKYSTSGFVPAGISYAYGC